MPALKTILESGDAQFDANFPVYADGQFGDYTTYPIPSIKAWIKSRDQQIIKAVIEEIESKIDYASMEPRFPDGAKIFVIKGKVAALTDLSNSLSELIK